MNIDDYFYAWKPALFRKRTRGMSLIERAIYRELIDEYMLTREPLPSEDAALAEIARIPLEIWIKHKDAILCKFDLNEETKVFHHEHCDEELDFQDKNTKKKSKAGKKAAVKRWKNKEKTNNATAMRNVCDDDANAMRIDATGQDRTIEKNIDKSISQKKKTTDPKKPKQKTKIFQLPDWIPKDLWEDFMEVRKKLKAVQTVRALGMVVTELEKLKAQGHDPTEVIEQSIRSSWKDVYPVKGKNHERPSNSSQGGYAQSISDRADQVTAEVIAEYTAQETGTGEDHADRDDCPPMLRHPEHLRQDPGSVENIAESDD